jgi:non-homologous end joining protein Ku
VVDLMEALKRSVEEVQGRKTAKASATKKKAAPKSGSRRQPARKSA